jgi:hypothetical protein
MPLDWPQQIPSWLAAIVPAKQIRREWIKAVADRFRDHIESWDEPTGRLPEVLRPDNLLRICGTIEANAKNWSSAKLFRRIGFVEAAIIAAGILSAEEVWALIEEITELHG